MRKKERENIWRHNKIMLLSVYNREDRKSMKIIIESALSNKY